MQEKVLAAAELDAVEGEGAAEQGGFESVEGDGGGFFGDFVVVVGFGDARLLGAGVELGDGVGVDGEEGLEFAGDVFVALGSVGDEEVAGAGGFVKLPVFGELEGDGGFFGGFFFEEVGGEEGGESEKQGASSKKVAEEMSGIGAHKKAST